MIELRRRAYLDAMGFDVWAVKPPAVATNRLILQAGDGDTLLICAQPDHTASRFAGDVARTLGGRVVWAWPDPEGSSDCPTLDEAVRQFLFTRVMLFGTGLARRIAGDEISPVVGSAFVQVTEDMEDLAVTGRAKRKFWNQLCTSGAVNSTDGK
ncbi:MAG: hypothetical protein HKN57_05030 [Xanthomonadales bacterium]|nr:hypothetical protein [Gammaproteobacteria bacterium]MBT8052647.1 hypothetical protein [Gammaproteobacteria bacterium]NND56594.1 hypothetical protein [Xanthomonadales bacterium]NNK52464.1 hypothetical protein [Xanthomonadales bacterium]